MSLNGLKCIRVKLVAYTPWWGGDYTTATMSNGMIAPLTSDTLKGVMRWVARGLIAAALGRAPPIYQLDEMLEEWFGGVRGREAKTSILRVHVEPDYNVQQAYNDVYNAFHTLRQAIVGLSNTIQKAVRNLRGCKNATVNETRLMIEVLDTIGRNLIAQGIGLLQQATPNTNPMVNDVMNVIRSTIGQLVANCPRLKSRNRWDAINQIMGVIQTSIQNTVRQITGIIQENVVARAITLLMTVPRVKLLALGATNPNELLEKLPVPLVLSIAKRVNTILKFRVELCVDTFACTARRVDCDTVLRFSLATLALAAILVGFGKASSRGFGRFVLTDIDPPNYPQLVRLINSFTNILQGEGGSAESLKDKLVELIKMAMEDAKQLVKQDGKWVENQKDKDEVAPCLAPAPPEGEATRSHVKFRIIKGIRHPLPLHLQLLGRNQRSCSMKQTRLRNKPLVRDVISALSAIGNATLKVAWKMACCATSDSHGAPFHTWILGLPRSQKGLGYMLRRNRRKSPIVLMPVCNQNSCIVLVAEFRTYGDHLNVLQGPDRLAHKGYSRKDVSELLLGRQNVGVQCCGKNNLQAHLVRVPAGQQQAYSRRVCSNCVDAPCRKLDKQCIDAVFESAYSFINYLLA